MDIQKLIAKINGKLNEKDNKPKGPTVYICPECKTEFPGNKGPDDEVRTCPVCNSKLVKKVEHSTATSTNTDLNGHEVTDKEAKDALKPTEESIKAAKALVVPANESVTGSPVDSKGTQLKRGDYVLINDDKIIQIDAFDIKKNADGSLDWTIKKDGQSFWTKNVTKHVRENRIIESVSELYHETTKISNEDWEILMLAIERKDIEDVLPSYTDMNKLLAAGVKTGTIPDFDADMPSKGDDRNWEKGNVAELYIKYVLLPKVKEMYNYSEGDEHDKYDDSGPVDENKLYICKECCKTFKSLKATCTLCNSPNVESIIQKKENVNEDEKNSYQIVATGISDKITADKLAQEKKGTVIPDSNDKTKFTVVVKECTDDQKEFEKEKSEHPELSDDIVRQIVADHAKLPKQNEAVEGETQVPSGMAITKFSDIVTVKLSVLGLAEDANYEVLDKKVKINYGIDVQAMKWGIKDIDIHLPETIEIDYKIGDEHKTASFKLDENQISWVSGFSLAPKNLVVTVDENNQVQSAELEVSYIDFSLK